MIVILKMGDGEITLQRSLMTAAFLNHFIFEVERIILG